TLTTSYRRLAQGCGAEIPHQGRFPIGRDRPMSTGFPFFLSGAAEGHLRRSWGWFLVLGVLLILAGAAAISYPVVATIATVELFGYLLIFGAAVEIASGIWTGTWGGFFLHLFGGLLYLFLGILLVDRPALGALSYTLILAVFFVAGGLVRAVFSLTHRF